MDSFSPHTAIPDLIQLGRQVVRNALARCAGSSALPYLAAVDGTCGNGHDTLFLAETLAEISRKPRGVFAFDVQPAAIEATRVRLIEDGTADSVSLLLKSHARLAEELARPENYPASLAGAPVHPEGGPAADGSNPPVPLRIVAAMYNLGFLPRSDKCVTTAAASTLASLESAAALLIPRGILVVHAYGGHPGGLEEMAAVDAWHAALPFDGWTAAKYALHNKTRNPEALFLAEKREKP